MRYFLTALIICLSGYLPFSVQACDCGCNEGALGILWGDFDLPTKAQLEIIKQALNSYEIKKLVIIINDFSKTLDKEKMLKRALPSSLKTDIIILTQDKDNVWDYSSIKQKFSAKYNRFYAVMDEELYIKILDKHGKNYIEKNYDVVLLFLHNKQLQKNKRARNVLLSTLPAK